jgi:hypothetical protein
LAQDVRGALPLSGATLAQLEVWGDEPMPDIKKPIRRYQNRDWTFKDNASTIFS